MKVEAQYVEPEHVKGRQPYRLRIEGKDGQVIEITEQMGGGFCVRAATDMGSTISIHPLASNNVFVTTKGRP